MRKRSVERLTGKLNIQSIPLSKMKEAEYNPRKISEEALEGLTGSLERWDLLQPIVWNKKTGNIVGGHQRKKVLLSKGLKNVDAVVVDLSLEEEKALNVALNNEHIQGSWDYQKLSDIFKDLKPDMLKFTFFPEHEFSLLMDGEWTPPKFDDVGADKFKTKDSKKSMVCPHCGREIEIE
jgi:hypothetical protein